MIILDKENPRMTLDKAITSYEVDLTWAPQTRSGEDNDLDMYMAVLGAAKPVDADLVYHRTKPTEINGVKIIQHPTGCVVYSGDDKTGAKGEKAVIYLDKLPADKERVSFAVEIAFAESRKQVFSDIESPKITLTNPITKEVEVRIDLDEDFTTETCMIAFEIYRYGDELKIRRIAQAYKSGLRDFLIEKGFEVAPRTQV